MPSRVEDISMLKKWKKLRPNTLFYTAMDPKSASRQQVLDFDRNGTFIKE